MNPSGPRLDEATRGDEAGLASRSHVGGVAFVSAEVIRDRCRNEGINYEANRHRCPQEGNPVLQLALIERRVWTRPERMAEDFRRRLRGIPCWGRPHISNSLRPMWEITQFFALPGVGAHGEGTEKLYDPAVVS